ncbi:MAG: hypothetical protein A2049_06345 [Elusimicrobia bacterium GWA2_62_23]|nr:MAG: hypothetical protein A2049_06345 [Elusimicrobia bacterium GWA2_62_23]
MADEQGRIFMSEKVIKDNKDWARPALEKEILTRLRGTKMIWMPVIPGEEAVRIYSYTNSLRVNNTIFMPTYYDRKYAYTQPLKARDDAGAAVYEGLGFKVVKVFAFDAIQFGGAVHCITREVPCLPWF